MSRAIEAKSRSFQRVVPAKTPPGPRTGAAPKANKSLSGQKFFLDLPGIPPKRAAQIKEDLTLSGAEVCEFLSKDISYLVTTRKEDYSVIESQSGLSTPSPAFISTPSPFTNKTKSPWMVSPRSADARKSVVESQPRGKKFVQEAAETRHQGSSNLVQLAQKFKVKVRPLERITAWLAANKAKRKASGNSKSLESTKAKVWKLEPPFIKVEDMSRKYQPLWIQLKAWPTININSAARGEDGGAGGCPFGGVPKHKTARRRDSLQQKKSGYCECCCENFVNIDLHLKSEKHRSFAENDENYAAVDAVIAKGLSLEEFFKREEEKEEEEKEENDDFVIVDESPPSRCGRDLPMGLEFLPKDDQLILSLDLNYEEMKLASQNARTLRSGKRVQVSAVSEERQTSSPSPVRPPKKEKTPRKTPLRQERENARKRPIPNYAEEKIPKTAKHRSPYDFSSSSTSLEAEWLP
ncbi:protein DBF4 homolog B-like isoform X2 [Oscarella lobularis]|uniref:protein DBF4 homolog B-like isoform X2 n=1 Tax=Oscarella lobularis TaxID=121494 RepID=UPI003313FA14